MWRELTETDLAATLAQSEIDAYRRSGPLDGADPVVLLLDRTRGFVQRACGMTPGAFGAFPAQELYRLMERKQKRDWAARWNKAYKKVNGEGALQSPCIALKTSPIWTALSAFGHPYPPFDWGSGMDVRDVSADRAIELGLISRDELKIQVRQMEEKRDSGAADFNKGLEVDDPHGNLYGELKKHFGDQIRRVDGKIVWREEVFKEAFEKDNFTIRLGQATGRLLKEIPDFNGWKNSPLTITQDWLNNIRPDDGTDHRSHFAGYGNDSTPLELRDISILPSLWRRPDRAWLDTRKGRTGRNNIPRLILELDAIDGSIFRAVVDIGTSSPYLKTFFKKSTPLVSIRTSGSKNRFRRISKGKRSDTANDTTNI